MKKFILLIAMLVACVQVWAQERTVSGKVTSDEGEALPGVNVLLKGTSRGAVTDIDGNYALTVPQDGGTLVFSFIGLETQEVQIGNRSVIDVSMASDVTQLSEVVVTAMGVDRDKASLGYSTQQVSGDEVSTVKDVNFMNSLSGKVAGVAIKRSNQMGGSTNVIVRGYKSFNNNQALFVVDGVIISNAINNDGNQTTGRGGYDYGNAAMDINPDDIATINVLKGAAATVLYGSRAANGVVLITTKKGASRQGVGVTASFGTTFGSIDKSTFIRYQDEYGPGYSTLLPWYGTPEGFDTYDFGSGENLAAAVYEDASYGPRFDPNLDVYDWRSWYEELGTYGQLFPYVAGANDGTTFYETGRTINANLSVSGGNEVTNYRVSYTNVDQNGVLPNSNIKRNTLAFAGGYNITEKLNVSSTINYNLTEAVGRYGTGYDNRNVNQSFRQWYNVGTDIQQQKEAYDQTGLNLTWNPYATLNPAIAGRPHYFDNYYFNRHENFNSDERNRIFGNVKASYEIADGLSIVGRASTDRYSEIREERIAVGSIDVSSYFRQNRIFSENNYDLFLDLNRNLSEAISITGLIGTNIRRAKLDVISAQTNGGLVTPGVYSLSNSVNNPEAPGESFYELGTNGYFADIKFGFNDFIYLGAAARYDQWSTLPEGDNGAFYPSASLSFVFSELVDSDVLTTGIFRANYGQVGNGAGTHLVRDIYLNDTPFNGVPLASASSIRRNPNLVNERTENKEIGLELGFLQNRVGLDISAYQSNSYDQIFTTQVTAASGRLSQVVNAGNIENKGIEVTLRGTPIQSGDFKWDVNVNWSLNRNKVLELYEDQDNIVIYSAQGGITVNATVGEPYGTIKGTNYQFDEQGRPIVYAHPYGGVRFRKTATPEVIGDINPDWTGGIQNILSYKGVSLSFLIDMQKGGDFFSLDTWYGYATGVYDITAGTNADGNPRRDRPQDGGGTYLSELDYLDFEAVAQATDGSGAYVFDEDGNPVGGDVNEEAFFTSDVYNSFGYAIAPNSLHVYDASYVKLREVALSFALPSSVIDRTPFQGASLSLVGRNLWIIHKNSPYSDPEEGLSAGNNLGNQSGAYPAVKEYGFNLSLRF